MVNQNLNYKHYHHRNCFITVPLMLQMLSMMPLMLQMLSMMILMRNIEKYISQNVFRKIFSTEIVQRMTFNIY